MSGITRSEIFPEAELPCARAVMDEGKRLSKDWKVGHSEFLSASNVSCEAEYKRGKAAEGKIMQHAQVGYRDKVKSNRALAEIYEACLARSVTVDRYGICLDWSMGFPEKAREKKMRGTGLILDGAEDFAALGNAAPAASHYGDFVLGFPAALENTQYALAAGATAIGNLGQYFTFRLPDWNDDIACTESTLTALALMASQPVDILVHSNLDDGFAAVFEDLRCTLGAVLVEHHIIGDLIGGKVSHCYGHHYGAPRARYAFQKALAQVSSQPGTMVYGSTAAYRGTDAENYADLAGYLLVDIFAQRSNPSGHAINPVPVTENKRIPDVDEIIDAQLFAGRLIRQSEEFQPVVDEQQADRTADALIAGAKIFKKNLLQGFENAGIDTGSPFEMLLAIRRIGGKRLEALYGPGKREGENGRAETVVLSDTIQSIRRAIQTHAAALKGCGAEELENNGLRLVAAAADVHEHGKMLVEGILSALDIDVIDGGVSIAPGPLAAAVEKFNADAVMLSTYNGVALTYFLRLRDELAARGMDVPIFIGGRLNEIPDDDKDSLPRDVTPELERQGAIVCRQFSDAMPCLIALAKAKAAGR